MWATERIKEYIVKGFAMDDDRLKRGGGGAYFEELLARIRDIRSSEKVILVFFQRRRRPMLGAIIGDIAGSRFEFNNHRSKQFELFTDKCFATDDSIMTLAVARAIMEAERSAGSADRDDAFYSALGGLTAKSMREIGQRYPHCGYGGRFHQWMFCRNPRPYDSFGNGAAMRISPADAGGGGMSGDFTAGVRRGEEYSAEGCHE